MAAEDRLDSQGRKSGVDKSGLIHMETVNDDRQLFEPMSLTEISSHFRDWAILEYNEPDATIPSAIERYRRSIYVDEHCMESVLANTETYMKHDVEYGGWVNVVWPCEHDEAEFHNWEDRYTERVNVPWLYNGWYDWPNNGESLYPPFIWVSGGEFWPARNMMLEDVIDIREYSEELELFYDHEMGAVGENGEEREPWKAIGGVKGYVEYIRSLGRSIYKFDGPCFPTSSDYGDERAGSWTEVVRQMSPATA